MIAWNEYFGFSLLCYIQRECNYKFTDNGVHHKFVFNPKGFEIAGPRVRGLADFSAMPNVYPWEKREEWRRVAEEQSWNCWDFMSREWLREVEWDNSSVLNALEIATRSWSSGGSWNWGGSRSGIEVSDIYVGPDIFIRDGELVDYFGRKRKFLGVEHFSAPLIFRNGMLGPEDVADIGDYVLKVDEELGLQGEFVDALWSISQFNLSGVVSGLGGFGGRDKLCMIADKGSRILAISCGSGNGLGCDEKEKEWLRRVKEGAVIVRSRWCVELYRLFFENISLRMKNEDFERS